MGQRLNIEILDNGVTLANSYYHWSGYTSSAINLTRGILNHIEEVNQYDGVRKAIALLESTGAGLTEVEKEYAIERLDICHKQLDFKDCSGRNDGLIAVSEVGIDNTRKWEEARVTIDISNQTVDFNALYSYSYSEYIEEYSCCTSDTELHVLDLDFDISSLSFDAFEKVADTFLDLIKKGVYRFSDECNSKVYLFIE